MIDLQPDEFLPVELVFNPNWWHKTAGISFDESFYLMPTRASKTMSSCGACCTKSTAIWVWAKPIRSRGPIIGSMHVAGGFVIPALLGARIRFEADAAPQPEPVHWTTEQIEAFELPDWRNLWPMKQLIADMDTLEAQVWLRDRRSQHGWTAQRGLSLLRARPVRRFLSRARSGAAFSQVRSVS